MTEKKILLVTFPVDLGNRTIESNFQYIFQNDMSFFSFAAQHADSIDIGRVSIKKSILYRLLSIKKLRKTVKQAVKDERFVLFDGISPALFAYGIWIPSKTAITFDWTRTLYDQVLGKKIKQGLVFLLHKFLLNHCKCIICWTDAVIENLKTIYNVNPNNIHKACAPLLVEKMDIVPRATQIKPRVLFVGGDLYRKGGDVILKNWKERLEGKCSLTMMTNDSSANIDGINYLPGIKYGTEAHKNVFKEHDILLLPTRIDAYPQVIGEAVAAGMAVISTKFALGAKEMIDNGVTGYICDSPEACIDQLLILLKNINLIDSFKEKGYNFIHKKFNTESIRKQYLDIIGC